MPTESTLLVWMAVLGGVALIARGARRFQGGRRLVTVERVLVVGPPVVAQRLAEDVEAVAPGRYRVVGVVDDSPRDGRRTRIRRLGPPSDLAPVIAEQGPDCIVIARRGELPAEAEEALIEARLRGVMVEDPAGFAERVSGKMAIEALSPRTLIFSSGFRHSDLVAPDGYHVLTRALNLAAAALGLVLLAPLLAVIAAAIVIDSGRPVLFSHLRVGQGGRPFGLLKFRTMHPARGPASEWVRDNGHRISRVGRWLRRWRLDELPQLVNVLRGEMNLVGPRPHPVSNYRLFLERIPFYAVRTAVKPGITGWAQIRYGYANGLDEETEKMRYDLYYIKHRSLWLDVRVLVETLGVVLFNSRSHEAAHHRATAAPRSPATGVGLSA